MTVRDIESELARAVHERGSFRRRFVKWYNANRLLENAVRDFAQAAVWDELEGKYFVTPKALESLRRRVPINRRSRLR